MFHRWDLIKKVYCSIYPIENCFILYCFVLIELLVKCEHFIMIFSSCIHSHAVSVAVFNGVGKSIFCIKAIKFKKKAPTNAPQAEKKE